MTGAAPRVAQQKVVGEAQVLQVFEMQGRRADAKTAVAGCRIAEGSIRTGCTIKVLRGGDLVSTVIPAVPLTSWQRLKHKPWPPPKGSALLHLRHAFASPLAVGARRGTRYYRLQASSSAWQTQIYVVPVVHVDCHGLHDKYVVSLHQLRVDAAPEQSAALRRAAEAQGSVPACICAIPSCDGGSHASAGCLQIHEGPMASLKRQRLDVERVGKGTECGVALEGFGAFQPGDVLQCIELEMVAPKLDSIAAQRPAQHG